MATFSRAEILAGLQRLGELAQEKSVTVQLTLMGGAVMVLAYEARLSTHDVDVLIRSPREARIVRELAQRVAAEQHNFQLQLISRAVFLLLIILTIMPNINSLIFFAANLLASLLFSTFVIFRKKKLNLDVSLASWLIVILSNGVSFLILYKTYDYHYLKLSNFPFNFILVSILPPIGSYMYFNIVENQK